MRLRNIFQALICVALLCGCSQPKNITYFQDMQDGQAMAIAQEKLITIQPDDKLNIIVKSKDPRLSALFNLPLQSDRIGGNMTESTDTYSSSSSSQGTSSYTVSQTGEINFPVIGNIKVAGMTRSQIAATIKESLISRSLVNDPVVIVEYGNMYYSVLGEVNSPGRYTFDRDKISVLDAIALAGDLTIQGQRKNVMVIRMENGQQKTYKLDLTSTDQIVNSPVYYLQQKDIIYVDPNAYRQRQTTVNGNNLRSTGFWFSVASLVASVAVLITNLL